MKSFTIVTMSMGNSWCGDCLCIVYEDGTIQYRGLYDWQKSERRNPIRNSRGEWAEPDRPYRSEIKETDYFLALKAAREDKNHDWFLKEYRRLSP